MGRGFGGGVAGNFPAPEVGGFIFCVFLVFFSRLVLEVLRELFFCGFLRFGCPLGGHFLRLFVKSIGFLRKGVSLVFVTPYNVLELFSWFGLFRNALNMKKTASGNWCFFSVRK